MFDYLSLLGPSATLFVGFFLFIILFAVAIYVYTGLTLMTVAKKLEDPQPWLAWIPVANLVLMARLAKMHWWPIILIALPMVLPKSSVIGGIFNFIAMIVFMVFLIIWTWKICEARGKPGWWSLLILIPFLGGIWYFIMWGILAWEK